MIHPKFTLHHIIPRATFTGGFIKIRDENFHLDVIFSAGFLVN